jgi:hypothetical protein
MSEQDSPSADPEKTNELPPIPDGGLRQAMPSWLATPPSRSVKLAGEPTPINLDALAGSSQLPQWLIELSARVEEKMPVSPAGIASSPESSEANVAESLEPVPEAMSRPQPVAAPVAAIQVTEPSALVESRSRSTYALYVLAVIVVVALAAWLIWR